MPCHSQNLKEISYCQHLSNWNINSFFIRQWEYCLFTNPIAGFTGFSPNSFLFIQITRLTKEVFSVQLRYRLLLMLPCALFPLALFVQSLRKESVECKKELKLPFISCHR